MLRPREQEEPQVDFWTRLERVRSERNVLDHPFYRRWSRGELSPADLAAYAGQYRHAVVALAEASAGAAAKSEGPLREHLEEHAAEEAAHIALWDRFVEAAGGDAEAPASPETAECARVWRGRPDQTLDDALVGLYAIEAAQPGIAEVKRDGLTGFYGFEPGEATAYFDLHATLDVEHARAHRTWLDERLAGADEEELLSAAGTVLAGNWTLLDGVESLAAP
jgi:pyrroloquinoline-quinone synthase